jgi:hypothetical protein
MYIICVNLFIAEYCVAYVSKFLRQLSRAIDPPRPDKNVNSRFEYTKILNTVHAATLSELATLRIKRPYVSILSLAPYVSFFFSPKKR